MGRLRHSWLVQIRSLPEMIFTATVLLENVNEQAGTSVTSLNTIRIGLPAISRRISGSTVTSSGSHGPSGWASGGVVGLAFLTFVGVGAAVLLGRRAVARGRGAGLAGDLPGGVAAGGRTVAAAAQHPADHEDQQEREPEHEQSSGPVHASRQRAARTGDGTHALTVSSASRGIGERHRCRSVLLARLASGAR